MAAVLRHHHHMGNGTAVLLGQLGRFRDDPDINFACAPFDQNGLPHRGKAGPLPQK